MAFVVSEGALRSLERVNPAHMSYSLRLADDFTQDYAQIFRSQPAVRTVVQFLARNIASLGIHVFRRIDDNDRERLTDHPLATLFGKPNPATTRFRLVNSLVHDLGIYDAAYWLKVKSPQPALVRVPPESARPIGDNWMWPEGFELFGKRQVGADEVVYFRGYNPRDERVGCSPLEALRRILAEEFEAGRMREQVLRNGARTSGYIERPKDAPKWEDGGKRRFKESWQAQYSGNGPQAGGTPVLEDGMTFKPASQTAEQLQYIESRKLTREEVAAAYFIPPPMVGILDNATFSNIEEQHKMLYQDTLGPWLRMITDEIGLQLVGDLPDSDRVYVEFNLEEKMRGSFEEQAQRLQSSVGAPWLTRNEARSRQNLPPIEGGDDLVVPLNVLSGGLASPRDTAPEPGDQPTSGEASGVVRVKGRAPASFEAKAAEVVRRFFKRQGAAVRSALGSKASAKWWDEDRWNKELSDDLYALAVETSKTVAASTLDAIGFGPDAYDVDRTLKFLRAVAARIGGGVNAATRAQIDAALGADDPAEAVAHVFEVAEGSRSDRIGVTALTTVAGFATAEAARQVAGDRSAKTWRVTSGKPRASHAAVDGETVGIDDVFSNGALWPGDSILDVDEVAGCSCELEISIS